MGVVGYVLAIVVVSDYNYVLRFCFSQNVQYAGHVIFFDKEDRLAIVGDVLFAGSIGRTDFPRGNHADLINAIKTKLWPLGDDVQFVPGHGPMSTFGKERSSNPYVGEDA